MPIYHCDHCRIEFGCERDSRIICPRCGKEQMPPPYEIKPVEHAVQGAPETAMRQTKPVSRLARVFGRRKK